MWIMLAGTSTLTGNPSGVWWQGASGGIRMAITFLRRRCWTRPMLEFRLSDSYCMSKKKKYPTQASKTCTHLQSSSYTPDGGDRNELCGEVATHYHDGRGQWVCERHSKK